MDQLVDKKSLFLNQEISDFVIIIGDQRLNVHKSVLMSSSEYFSALFNSEMIETKTKEISLKETLIKPFMIVLKLSYDIVITDEEWLDLRIQELFESIITANKYQFIECERQLSQKLIDIFGYRVSEVTDQMTEHSMLTIWELLEMAKLHNLMFLIEFCLQFFDENINYAFKTFDNQFISADILLDVISRDTFGAPEVEIFMLVQKWIQKHRIRSNRKCIEETLLLESVRLTLMSLEQLSSVVLKSGLYESELIEKVAKHELSGDLAQNKRICNESGKLVTNYCTNDLHLRNEQLVVVCVNCVLPMPSKINHLLFTIKPMDSSQRLFANYWIGISDSQADNGFRKVLDYTKCLCIGEQELYFEEPFVTHIIRIVLECNIEDLLTPGFEPTPEETVGSQAAQSLSNWRRRSRSRIMRTTSTYRDPKLLNISSIKYEFSKIPLKVMDSCIVPEINVCQKFGADCCLLPIGYRFNDYLNTHVLNNSRSEPLDVFPIDESIDTFIERVAKVPKDNESTFCQFIQRPIVSLDENSYYIIRLTQPIYADCLQFELILENERRRQSDACLAAECKVEICQSFTRDLDCVGDWIAVSDDSYLAESGFYNLEFGLQKVSVIKISGFRYNSDKSVKYLLHLKNFSIPADRQSWSWTSGSKLGNESINIDDDWN